MNRAKISALAAVCLLFGAVCATAGQKIVTFDPSYPIPARILGIESLGGEVKKDLHLINALAASFPDEIKVSDIYSLRGVRIVEDDLSFKWIEEVPTGLPLAYVSGGVIRLKTGEQTPGPEIPPAPAPHAAAGDTEIPWGVKRVNAAGVWKTSAGEGIKVAVIDTGMDYTHPDLAANYAGGYNAITPGAEPLDDQGHGTHVAGTIGAVRNAKGVAGVAPEVSLYAVKVLNSGGTGAYSDIVDGIQWAVDNKMQVINMSIGDGGHTQAMASAVKAADKAGIAIVCAAGNDSGAVNYPARYPESIAVSASNSSDKLAYFSSRGPEIAFIAPGTDIKSTYKGGKYTTLDGTSMASPHVAGLAALAVALGADTPAKVRAALKKAASSLKLKPAEEGAGMIDAAKLLNDLK